MHFRFILFHLLCFFAFAFRGNDCQFTKVLNLTTTPVDEKGLLAGFIYLTSPADFGWTLTHDQGRVAVSEALHGVVRTIYESNVTVPRMKEVAARMVSRGAQVIVATGVAYMYEAEDFAVANPSVKVICLGGFTRTKTAPNFITLYQPIHNVYILGGIMAGIYSKTGKGGFIASLDFSTTRRAAAAFSLGAKMVNPNFTLYFVHNGGQWIAPARTRKDVRLLIDRYDVDFFTVHNYFLGVSQAATDFGKMVFSFPSEFPRALYGENVLSGCIVSWGEIYLTLIKEILNGSVDDLTFLAPLQDGTARLAPLSENVNATIAALVNSVQQQIVSGQYCVFNNQSANLASLIPASQFDENGCLTDAGVKSFNVLTEGVINLGFFPDEQVFTKVTEDSSSPSSIALFVIVGFFDVLILISMGVVRFFNKTLLIVTINEYFCYGVLFGSLMGYSGIFFWLGEPTVTSCNARIWFLCYAFSMVFGCLAAKTYKMWRIWTKPEIKQSERSNQIIAAFIGGLFFLQTIFLILITTLKGYAPAEYWDDGGLEYDQYYVRCSLDPTGQALLGLILGCDGLVIFVTAFFAYLSRNVNKRFNEMPSIVVAIYSILISIVIVVLLFVITNDPRPERRMIIMACGIFIGVTFPLVSLFVPKFYMLWKEVSGSQTRSTGSHSSSNHNDSHHASGPGSAKTQSSRKASSSFPAPTTPTPHNDTSVTPIPPTTPMLSRTPAPAPAPTPAPAPSSPAPIPVIKTNKLSNPALAKTASGERTPSHQDNKLSV